MWDLRKQRAIDLYSCQDLTSYCDINVETGREGKEFRFYAG